MEIKNNYHISKSSSGKYTSNLSGTWKEETDLDLITICRQIYEIKKSNRMSDSIKNIKIDALIAEYHSKLLAMTTGNYDRSETKSSKVDAILGKTVCQQLINFFTEFDFEPNFRFVNTLSHCAQSSIRAAKNYVQCYFALVDHPNVNEINSKVSSREFEDIINNLKKCGTTSHINRRFEIFYGSQGTGKTTEALVKSKGVCMVCHSAMLPSDLMEDFTFVDGKATFKPSALWNAMVDGTVITLDEINLLPFESLRFLQSILDGKASFVYKGTEIKIAHGFEIIGTMNLKVNGSVFNLPEPLVDRAFNIQNYKLSAEQLMEALN